MYRLILLFVIIAFYSCSDKNKSNTTYIMMADHYDQMVERGAIDILNISDYSHCPSLAISTFKSKIIRFDLPSENEEKIIYRNFAESLFGSKLTTEKYSKKLSKFKYPNSLKVEKNEDFDTKDIQYFLSSFDPSNTKIFALNSTSLYDFGLNINNEIKHYGRINDLKDGLMDYICNDIGVKNAIIFLHLSDNLDNSFDECLRYCNSLSEKRVCGDNGREYRNIECLECHTGVKQITCPKNQSITTFKKEMLTERAFEIFYQFAEAQNLIANAETDQIANEVIENTMRLFDGNKSVEIANLGNTLPIRLTTVDYLKRLKSDKFIDIDINWDVDWTVTKDWDEPYSEMKNNSMQAIGKQYFTGHKRDLVVYSDVVKKNVTFHAKLIETIDENGEETLEWKVFLGNIQAASPSERM